MNTAVATVDAPFAQAAGRPNRLVQGFARLDSGRKLMLALGAAGLLALLVAAVLDRKSVV